MELILSAENKKTGMGSHQSAKMQNDEWLTPPSLIQTLGPFDLDPCAPIKRPWEMAKEHFTVADDGLMKPWNDFVWLNPPYGNDTGKWLRRLFDHGHGITLIFARTETEMFHQWVWKRAHSIFFFEGRLFFHHVDGTVAKHNVGAPSCLVAYGADATMRIVMAHKNGKIKGHRIHLRG